MSPRHLAIIGMLFAAVVVASLCAVLTTPHDTGVMFHIKTRDAQSHEWSPWLYMGQWGRTPITDPADHVVTFDRGVVHVDNLTLDAPADAYQIRATLLSFSIDRAANPSIRRITVSYSGQVH